MQGESCRDELTEEIISQFPGVGQALKSGVHETGVRWIVNASETDR